MISQQVVSELVEVLLILHVSVLFTVDLLILFRLTVMEWDFHHMKRTRLIFVTVVIVTSRVNPVSCSGFFIDRL